MTPTPAAPVLEALRHATGYESTMPSRGKPYSKLTLRWPPTNEGHRHAMVLLSVVMEAMRERETTCQK